VETPNTTYDFIIAGAGLSGLSMCIELLKSERFKSSSILILDKDDKKDNDRTWSFWATAKEEIPDIAQQKWSTAQVYSDSDQPIEIDLAPYQYQTIKGIDFYNYAKSFIKGFDNVTWKKDTILEVQANGWVVTEQNNYQGQYVMKSFFNLDELPSPKQHSYLLQHFKGWVIETPEATFDVDKAVLMDYRTPQESDTRFFYVLPFSTNKALVEYTIFSKNLLEADEYDNQLRSYIKEKLQIEEYTIVETEFNAIPMTDYPFETLINQRVIYIGTIAGYVKPSSGYGFKRTLEKNRELVKQLEGAKPLKKSSTKSAFRFRLYDSILLHLMYSNQVSGKQIFSALFRKHPNATVFQFLDERTNFFGDLKIQLACPNKLSFTKAFFRQLFRSI